MMKKKHDLKWNPHNVAEYFFFDEFGFINITDRKILECYSEYTGTLHECYKNIKHHYIKIINKVIDESDLEHIDFPRVPKDIEQKGLEFYLDNELKERICSP
jgi:hypothetical protein